MPRKRTTTPNRARSAAPPARVLPVTACYARDGRWWLAEILEARNVATQGKTLAEARANLAEALVLLLEDADVYELVGHRKKHTITRSGDATEKLFLVIREAP